MLAYVIAALMSALVSAFALLLVKKWKIHEWVQLRAPLFFAEMFRCDFCLSWWFNVICCIAVVITMKDITYIIMPFMATPITRKFI